MCSINHDLKCIYFHIPKVGGLYITEILENIYDFKTYFFTSENHYDFINKNEQHNTIKGFYNIKKGGLYRYYRYSKKFNKMANMDDEKWETYYKFTFVRNPLDRFISAYKYLEIFENTKKTIINVLDDINFLNNYQYFHLFVNQNDQLIDKSDNINFNFIGKFENLNEDLNIILTNIGITELKHEYYLTNNIVINSSNTNEFEISLNKNNYTTKINYDINEFITEEVITKVCDIFKIDFDRFGYDKNINIDNYKLILNNKNNIIKKNKEILKKFNFKKYNNILNLNNLSKLIY